MSAATSNLTFALKLRIERAARVIRAGGVVAYPTEAVYGLGCLPDDARAVRRILAIKRRSWRKGLLLVAATLEQIERYADLDASPLRPQILATWPGPYTWVLPARPPLRSALEVRRLLGPALDDIVAGPLGDLASPTTIRDGMTGRILRG